MSTTSSIEWTDKTWNPVRGCSKVSAGCTNCYAMKVAHRFSGPGKPYEGLTKLVKGKGPQWTGDVVLVPDALGHPIRWRRPAKIFVNSMSDLFHEGVPDYFIDDVFAVMQACPQHIFQILTKRPERMAAYLDSNASGRVADAGERLAAERGWCHANEDAAWPLPNVWLGTSVENQAAADERIPHLIATPAAVRFLSMEPLLGPVDLDLSRWFKNLDKEWWQVGEPGGWHVRGARGERIHWVIVGGESGSGARVFNLAWLRGLLMQCRNARVPAFVKQLGAKPIHPDGDYTTFDFAPHVKFSGTGTGDVGVWLQNKKGADVSEWPEDLKVREFPEVPHAS